MDTPLTSGGDNCPSCGSSLAPDQRYCLVCGHRRGDPRLPFMDAVVFMDASKRQPVTEAVPAAATPARDHRPLLSANASLVAGVATLVLAIGVGVLIGRSGDGGASNASATPQIIRVGGGSETEAAANSTESKGSTGIGGGDTKGKSATKKQAKAKTETGKSGTSKAVEEVYEPAPGVKIAPPEQKLGGECDPGTAGCGKNGKFEGTFFE